MPKQSPTNKSVPNAPQTSVPKPKTDKPASPSTKSEDASEGEKKPPQRQAAKNVTIHTKKHYTDSIADKEDGACFVGIVYNREADIFLPGLQQKRLAPGQMFSVMDEISLNGDAVVVKVSNCEQVDFITPPASDGGIAPIAETGLTFEPVVAHDTRVRGDLLYIPIGSGVEDIASLLRAKGLIEDDMVPFLAVVLSGEPRVTTPAPTNYEDQRVTPGHAIPLFFNDMAAIVNFKTPYSDARIIVISCEETLI